VFYDTRQRRYEASASFSPIFGTPSLEAWLERSRRAGLAIEVLPTLDRPLDADLMARLYRAIRDRVTVHVAYQTMRRATAEDRILTPTAFVSDGQRWHVRAYCHLREAYRDFVLSRIALSPDQSQSGVRAAELPADTEWLSWVTLKLAPATHLEENQKREVCWDYGIDGELSVTVRRALEFYAIRRWGLDRPESRLSIIERVVKTNPPEADCIVSEIRKIVDDTAMAKRTIGVTTLLGQEQAALIRIARAHGKDRTGPIIRNLALGAVEDRFPRTQEDDRVLFWPEGASPDQPVPFRKSIDGLRGHSDIPFAELASIAAPDIQAGLTDEAILQRMTETFGLARLRQATRARFLAALEIARRENPNTIRS
jgi:hypothetical protein